MTDVYIDLSNNQDGHRISTYNVTPYMILKYFQSLIRLHYAGPIQDEIVTLRESSTTTATDERFRHQQLRYLTLQIYNTEGNLDLNYFIFATPYIEKLRLNFESVKHTITPLLSSIFSNHHCPNLSTLVLASDDKNDTQLTDHGQNLWVNATAPKPSPQNSGSYSSICDTNSSSRLQHLVLYDPDEKHHTTIQQILRFIIPQSHQTLQTLDILGAYKIHGRETMEVLSQHIFPLLTRFYLVNGRRHNLMAYGSLQHFKTFAEHSVPNVVDFKLVGLDSDYNMELLQLATSTKHLQELYLEDCPEIASATLEFFFRRLGSSYNNRDTSCCRVTNNPHRSNNEHLRMVAPTDKSSYLLHQQRIRDNTKRRMTKVTFRNIPGVDFDVLQALFQECYVEELTVHECDGLDIEDVGKLLDTLPYNDVTCIIPPRKLDLILTYYQPRFYFFASKVPVYPNSPRIQETLLKLDSSCMEWRLGFKDFSQLDNNNDNTNGEPIIQVYNHVEYRKQKIIN